jgi:hypothetical protein
MGMAEERVLLHDLLQRAWRVHGAGPLNVLQGYKDRQRFRDQVRRHHRDVSLDEDIARAFVRDLKQHDRLAKQEGRPTLRKRFHQLCQDFGRSRKQIPREQRKEQARFIGEVRALLAATCIHALEPDLIILDEFQRFRDLLHGGEGAGKLAQYLFEWPEARMLLLSATPYKMYSLANEGSEDHYRDFIETLKALLPNPDDVARCERLLKTYRLNLYQLAEGPCPELDKTKAEIESVLRAVMCRTERLAVTEDRSGMLAEKLIPELPLRNADIDGYLDLQAMARMLNAGNVVEYWKSAPYALNFMDKYQLKKQFTKQLAESKDLGELASRVRTAANLCLPWPKLRRYEAIEPPNPHVRHLLETTVGAGAWQILWVPPILPYYEFDDAFSPDFPDDFPRSGMRFALHA